MATTHWQVDPHGVLDLLFLLAVYALPEAGVADLHCPNPKRVGVEDHLVAITALTVSCIHCSRTCSWAARPRKARLPLQ